MVGWVEMLAILLSKRFVYPWYIFSLECCVDGWKELQATLVDNSLLVFTECCLVSSGIPYIYARFFANAVEVSARPLAVAEGGEGYGMKLGKRLFRVLTRCDRLLVK